MATPVFDAVTTNTSTAGRSSASFAHTCTGSNLCLLVFVAYRLNLAEPSISAITYNGVALTLVTSRLVVIGAARFKYETYRLIAPATGSNTLAVTYDSSVDPDAITAISYTGVNQTTPVGASIDATGESATPTVALTTANANSLIVAGAAGQGGDTYPFAPGSGTTERWDAQTSTSTALDIGVTGGEENAPTAQAYTLDFTMSVSDYWIIAAVEVREAAGGTLYYQSAGGALTPSGVAARRTATARAGALTPAGIIALLTSTARAGGITFTGNAAKKTSTTRAGALTTAGVVTTASSFVTVLAGAITFVGTAAASARKMLGGAIVGAGELTKRAGIGLAGALITAGEIVKRTTTGVAGSLTLSGVLGTVKAFFQALAGAVTTTGELARQTATSKAGELTLSGTVARGIYIVLAGALTTAGVFVASLVAAVTHAFATISDAVRTGATASDTLVSSATISDALVSSAIISDALVSSAIISDT